jgi:hypothetical protein
MMMNNNRLASHPKNIGQRSEIDQLEGIHYATDIRAAMENKARILRVQPILA